MGEAGPALRFELRRSLQVSRSNLCTPALRFELCGSLQVCAQRSNTAAAVRLLSLSPDRHDCHLTVALGSWRCIF